MSRTPAAITQADVARVIRAARKAGCAEVEVVAPGGARVIVQQLIYLQERRLHQPRFTAGLVDFAGPLTALWGQLDPIAVPSMPRHLRDLRPATEVVELDGVGHWPTLEAPDRVAAEIRARLVG